MRGRFLVCVLFVAMIAGCSSSNKTTSESVPTTTTRATTDVNVGALIVDEREGLFDTIDDVKQGCQLGSCSAAAQQSLTSLGTQLESLQSTLLQAKPAAEQQAQATETIDAMTAAKVAIDRVADLDGCATKHEACETATITLGDAILDLESDLQAWSS